MSWTVDRQGDWIACGGFFVQQSPNVLHAWAHAGQRVRRADWPELTSLARRMVEWAIGLPQITRIEAIVATKGALHWAASPRRVNFNGEDEQPHLRRRSLSNGGDSWLIAKV